MGFVTSRNYGIDDAPRPGSPVPQTGTDCERLLAEALRIIGDIGPDFSADRDTLLALQSRLKEGRFHLAVLGQFKRGKSTLLNAFLGQSVLPTSVVPLTAIPTLLEYGPDLRVRVCYQDEKPEHEFVGNSVEETLEILQGFVTEEGNPKNRLGVMQVEIQHPAPILQHGVVLIDTPGIGSTFTHNTEATLNFLPQCDAALFVVSADPPLTEVEADFLKAVKSRVARLFFIFNKVDYLSDEERHAALSFFTKVLREKIDGDEDYPIFCLSARRGLDAKIMDKPDLFIQSGLQAVENHLVNFLASEKSKTLQKAVQRKTRDVIEGALMRLKLSIASLQMPLEDLEKRLAIFGHELENAERERLAAQDLLAGDKKRTLERLEQEAETLRNRSALHLSRVVEQSLGDTQKGSISEQAVLDSLAQQVALFFQDSAEEVSRKFGQHVAETLRPHQHKADALIELIRKTAAQLCDIPYHAPDSSEAFEMKRRAHWVLRKRVPSLPIVIPEETLDKFLPSTMRINRLKKRLSRQIDNLVRHNVENLRWATLQNLNDAFRRFGLSLDQRFQETIAATHGAMHAAYVKRGEHAQAIADDLLRCEAAAADLAAIGKGLDSIPSDREMKCR